MSDIGHLIWGMSGQQKEFFQQLVVKNNINTVLDVACGSGELAVMLAGMGVEVVALDLEPGMIERARQKTVLDAAGPRPTFLLGDMRDVSRLCPEKRDLVTCVGNALPHLTRTDDIWGTLAQIYLLLQPGGVVVIHTLNYDRLLAEEIKCLPPVENREAGLKVTVCLEGELRGNTRLVFNCRVMRSEGCTDSRYEVPIRPLLHRELDLWLVELGFERIKNYGWYDGRNFNKDSWHKVTVAFRPAGSGK